MSAFVPLPTVDGGWPCILADPPWHHASRSANGQTGRSPSHHYATMSLSEICALPVGDVSAKSAHLFLWTTWPHLRQAFAVMDAWGYAYSSGFLTWVKLNPRAASALFLTESDLHVGMGYTSRKNSELLLLGRRGSPKRLCRGVREIVLAARRQHSRKPDQARARVEDYCPGPRLELFAREAAPGWTAWGDQLDRFKRAG